MFRSRIWSCLPVIAGLSVTACEGDEGRPVYPTYDKSVWELALAEPELSSFITQGTTAGLNTFLTEDQATYTVMAPSNAAFSSAQGLPTDPLELNSLLRFHILAGTIDSALLKIGGEFRTITATTVRIEPDGAKYTVMDSEGTVATFTKVDVYGSNGVLLIIDKVLKAPAEAPPGPMCGDGTMDEGEQCDDGNTVDGDGCDSMCAMEMEMPGTLAEVLASEGFNALLTAVMGTEAETILGGTGPITVFAPNDAAIAALGDISGVNADVLNNVLLNHIVDGKFGVAELTADPAPALTSLANLPLAVTAAGTMVGGAALGDNADIQASNGVIHELESVIIPPTIEQYVASVMRLNQTEAALTRAGGDVDALRPNTLTGAAPITFFAPSNMAWSDAMLEIAMVDTSTLANILLAHATAGQIRLDELTDGQVLTMLNGSMVTVDVAGDVITLSSGMEESVVTVDQSDRLTLTGAVHVVESLLDVDGTAN